METKRKTSRYITGMLAALALLAGGTLAGNIASAGSSSPSEEEQCRDEWGASSAKQSCFTNSLSASNGQCTIHASCKDHYQQLHARSWSGPIEHVRALQNCNAQLQLSSC